MATLVGSFLDRQIGSRLPIVGHESLPRELGAEPIEVRPRAERDGLRVLHDATCEYLVQVYDEKRLAEFSEQAFGASPCAFEVAVYRLQVACPARMNLKPSFRSHLPGSFRRTIHDSRTPFAALGTRERGDSITGFPPRMPRATRGPFAGSPRRTF